MTEALASVLDLRVAYPAGFRLDAVTVGVATGELVALIGPNGAGKSTLLRALIGLVPSDGGQINLAGKPLASWSRRDVAKHAAYVPQGAALDVGFSVEEVVRMGREPHRARFGSLGSADLHAVREALRATELEPLASRPVSTLSGGERQRVLLARALAQTAPLLVLDEPSNHLDLAHAHSLLSIVRAQVDRGGGAIVAIHDVHLAARFADRIVALKAGRIATEGTPRQVLESAQLAELFGISIRTAWDDGFSYRIEG